MKTTLLEASIFAKQNPELKRLLMLSGVLPVNDTLIECHAIESKLNVLYGSYGSGKSVSIVDILVTKCLELPYFRCYFGRKVFDRVRGSVHKTITDRIKDRNLTNYFSFSEKPNGTMVVKCEKNGNEFIPFGCDNSESMKSIKDPSHIFCEELDQFSFEDFGFLYSRLRKIDCELQFWGAFNTERVFQTHWIRKNLFDGGFSDKCYKKLVNYTDNYFINQEEYLDQLKIIAGGDALKLNAIAKGAWGAMRTGSEYWKNFSEHKHVKQISQKPDDSVHVSLDSNVHPYVTQSVWTVSTTEKKIKQIHELPCHSPNNNSTKAAKKFVEYLKINNFEGVVFVYGDPTIKNSNTIDEENRSFFDKYIAVLKEAGFVVVSRVSKSAPGVAISGEFVNEIYEGNIDGWQIEINDSCLLSIEDYIMTKENEEGGILKAREKDKELGISYEKYGHFSDAKRYFIVKLLENLFIKYKSRSRKSGTYSIPM